MDRCGAGSNPSALPMMTVPSSPCRAVPGPKPKIGRIELLAALRAADRQPEMAEVHDRSVADLHG